MSFLKEAWWVLDYLPFLCRPLVPSFGFLRPRLFGRYSHRCASEPAPNSSGEFGILTPPFSRQNRHFRPSQSSPYIAPCKHACAESASASRVHSHKGPCRPDTGLGSPHTRNGIGTKKVLPSQEANVIALATALISSLSM
jgi:hypothetical protein